MNTNRWLPSCQNLLAQTFPKRHSGIIHGPATPDDECEDGEAANADIELSAAAKNRSLSTSRATRGECSVRAIVAADGFRKVAGKCRRQKSPDCFGLEDSPLQAALRSLVHGRLESAEVAARNA